MKKLVFGLLATIILGCVGNAQITEKKIGIKENDVYKITVDESFLKKILEEQLRKDKNDVVLTKFEIIKDVYENKTSDEYYILLAQNESGSTKIAFLLQLNSKDEFVVSLKDDVLLRGTCTCSGCTRGCNPKREIDSDKEIVWKCSACSNRGTCTKSVTVSSTVD